MYLQLMGSPVAIPNTSSGMIVAVTSIHRYIQKGKYRNFAIRTLGLFGSGANSETMANGWMNEVLSHALKGGNYFDG